ncbi:MAG TPA: MFS transporter [Acidimicrobiales bacterium]|nr:MFS transporter [Acidimicrobiales bacterium]
MAIAPARRGPRAVAPGAARGLERPPTHGAVGGGGGALALTAVTLVLFLTFLDNTIVAVVLASVQSALHAGVGALQWVVNGYALSFASLMLAFGTLGDVLGRKRVMLGGVGLFCAGSVLCALAPSVGTLIAGRILMGVGAAASEPGTLSMVRHLYEDRAERARALGVWVAVSGLALALGPVVGGALSGLWSWRAVFWFNVVFGAAAFVLAWVSLPESADPTGRRLDAGGAVLAAGALAALSFAVISGETAGYRTPWIVALFALAALGVTAFVVRERRSSNPLVDVGFFRRSRFTGANVVAFAVYFGVFAVFFFVALYLQVVGSQSPYQTAVDFVPMAAGMVLASALTGRWVAAGGPRLPMALGCLAAGVGLMLTDTLLNSHSTVLGIGWPLALTGVGFGVALVPVTTAALSSIPPERSGMASSMTHTSRELGAVMGVAILGSVVNGQLTTNLVHRLATLGLPAPFRSQVVTAVTTGTVSGQASAAERNPAIASIVHRVVTAAYGAFSHGLELSLAVAAALMVLGAVTAALTMGRERPPPRVQPRSSAAPLP